MDASDNAALVRAAEKLANAVEDGLPGRSNSELDGIEHHLGKTVEVLNSINMNLSRMATLANIYLKKMVGHVEEDVEYHSEGGHYYGEIEEPILQTVLREAQLNTASDSLQILCGVLQQLLNGLNLEKAGESIAQMNADGVAATALERIAEHLKNLTFNSDDQHADLQAIQSSISANSLVAVDSDFSHKLGEIAKILNVAILAKSELVTQDMKTAALDVLQARLKEVEEEKVALQKQLAEKSA